MFVSQCIVIDPVLSCFNPIVLDDIVQFAVKVVFIMFVSLVLWTIPIVLDDIVQYVVKVVFVIIPVNVVLLILYGKIRIGLFATSKLD